MHDAANSRNERCPKKRREPVNGDDTQHADIHLAERPHPSMPSGFVFPCDTRDGQLRSYSL
jgi:hypothetical protein